MIIAIPVNENKKEVCVSFGRAPFFMFYNTDNKTSEYLVNTAANAQGGAGIKAAQAVVDKGASALITVRCGENAAAVFIAADIAVYKASGASAEIDIALLEQGKLPQLTSFHSGFHGRV